MITFSEEKDKWPGMNNGWYQIEKDGKVIGDISYRPGGKKVHIYVDVDIDAEEMQVITDKLKELNKWQN
jgi:hypothetical protein